MANKKTTKKKTNVKSTTKVKENKISEELKEVKEDIDDVSKNNKTLLIVFGLLIALFLLIILITSTSNNKSETNYRVENENGVSVYIIDNFKYVESKEETNLVAIEVEDKGLMIAELYPDIAPITVKNFKKLVSEKFYDGVTFHRVIDNFMIQTGDPTATGSGGSEENIKGEFDNNGFENPLSHTRGVLSMARRGGNPDTEETMNSASSQFFIVQADSTYLDGNYASFGQIERGLEVVDKIAKVSTDENDKPIKDVVINSIRFVSEYETNYDGE